MLKLFGNYHYINLKNFELYQNKTIGKRTSIPPQFGKWSSTPPSFQIGTPRSPFDGYTVYFIIPKELTLIFYNK